MTAVLDSPAPGAPAPGVGWAPGPLGAVQAADREIARHTAVRARAVAAFAASRPASADRAPGSPGAMAADRWAARAAVLRPVSEWTTQELAVALSVTEQAAQALLERSLTLVHRLPGTLAALEAGAIHPGHLWPLLDKVAPLADDSVRAALERDLLAWATRRGTVCTPAQLGDKVRRQVLERDARAAARDLARAVEQRGVTARPDRADGMSVVSALLTTPEAAALLAALGAYADALPADGRSHGQTMADCLLDLVLRPGEQEQPPVQVTLSVIAPIGALLGGDQLCEIDGQVVPAEVVRALLTALTGQPITVDTAPTGTAPTGTEPAPAGVEDDPLAGISPADAAHHAAPGDAAHHAAQAAAEAAWWEQIEARIAAGEFDGDPGPDHPDEPWPPDLGPPPESPGPTPAHVPDRWWARADAAVDDASSAVLAAQQALGHARRLVATAERADTLDETAWAAGPAGRVSTAPDALTALAAATDEARDLLAGLLTTTGGGGLADRPRLVLTHALTGAMTTLTGAMSTLTDLPALHRAAKSGTGLALAAPTNGYRPGAALDRHVRARDRRCRFPGCRRPVPRKGELDHATPWPAGQTSAANLTGYCTGHHRGKHQAPGWTHLLAPDGALTVTTPTGLTATTPPPY